VTVSSKSHQGKEQEKGTNGGPLFFLYIFLVALTYGAIITVGSYTFILFGWMKISMIFKALYMCLSSRDFIFLVRVIHFYSYFVFKYIITFYIWTPKFCNELQTSTVYKPYEINDFEIPASKAKDRNCFSAMYKIQVLQDIAKFNYSKVSKSWLTGMKDLKHG
jgi:hypothetical protein